MSRRLTRRESLRALGSLGLGAVLVASSSGRGADVPRPNIVFFLADDLRFDALGSARNSLIRTPNLAAIASQGVRFHNHFVTSSICCTSRASILTGMYARRHGVWDFGSALSAQRLQDAYPARLRAGGYYTGYCGKYGVGDPPVGASGFDSVAQISERYYEGDDSLREHHHNKRMVDGASAFLAARPAEQPFFLCVGFKSPHIEDRGDWRMGSFVPEPEILELYRDVTFPRSPSMSEVDYRSLPRFLQSSEGRKRWFAEFSTEELFQDSQRKYAALVTGMDAAIGRIVALLEKQSLMQSTVLIFSSDNGFLMGEHGLSGKWFGFEESMRVPLLIRPIERPSTGAVSAMTLNIDLAPTLLELAQVAKPPAMQGESLVGWFQGRAMARAWRSEFLYEHHLEQPVYPQAERRVLGTGFFTGIPASDGVRTQRYKYLRFAEEAADNELLFDLHADPRERSNIVRRAPVTLVDSLRTLTDKLIREAS